MNLELLIHFVPLQRRGKYVNGSEGLALQEQAKSKEPLLLPKLLVKNPRLLSQRANQELPMLSAGQPH